MTPLEIVLALLIVAMLFALGVLAYLHYDEWRDL